ECGLRGGYSAHSLPLVGRVGWGLGGDASASTPEQNLPTPTPSPPQQACTRARASAARVGEGAERKNSPAAASFAGFVSALGGANTAISGRLMASWRGGSGIFAPRGSGAENTSTTRWPQG